MIVVQNFDRFFINFSSMGDTKYFSSSLDVNIKNLEITIRNINENKNKTNWFASGKKEITKKLKTISHHNTTTTLPPPPHHHHHITTTTSPPPPQLSNKGLLVYD